MGEVIPFESDRLPDHIRQLYGDVAVNNDLAGGVSAGFPILSIKGKTWHIVQGDSRTLVIDDSTGDPRASLEIIILKANPHVSKVYYPNGYTEGSDEKPACYSNDGVAPDVGVADPQANKCAICPRNQWGSRITENGAKGKECADSRRLAVAPAGDPENPMLLRVPAGSLKELVAYSDTLNKRKAPYSAVVTKVAFDHTVAHQKLVFKPIRWLDANEIALVAEVQAGTTVASIIGADAAPREDEGDEIAGERPTNAGAVADKAPARAAAAAPRGRTAAKPVAAVEEVAAILEEEPQQQAAAAQAAKPAATVRGFGGSSEAKAAPAAAQAEPKAAPKASRVIDDVNASLDDILASIDD